MVSQLSAGGGPHRLSHVVVRVNGMGGAEPQGGVTFGGQGVDGHNRVGSGDSGALHGGQADAAAAHHDHRLPGIYPGSVGHRSHPGEDPTTQQSGRGGRQVLGDRHALGAVDDHRVGEGTGV